MFNKDNDGTSSMEFYYKTAQADALELLQKSERPKLLHQRNGARNCYHEVDSKLIGHKRRIPILTTWQKLLILLLNNN